MKLKNKFNQEKYIYIYIYIRNNNQKNVNQIWYKIQIGPNDKEWKKFKTNKEQLEK